MTQSTTQISAKRFYRQDSAPPAAPDGATWLTNADGSGSDTTSRYQYNAELERWELNSAVGPSEPTDGTPVAGATWRDTSSSNSKQYDGESFVNLGVTDHANLNNVTPGQHNRYLSVKNVDISDTSDANIEVPSNNTSPILVYAMVTQDGSVEYSLAIVEPDGSGSVSVGQVGNNGISISSGSGFSVDISIEFGSASVNVAVLEV